MKKRPDHLNVSIGTVSETPTSKSTPKSWKDSIHALMTDSKEICFYVCSGKLFKSRQWSEWVDDNVSPKHQ